MLQSNGRESDVWMIATGGDEGRVESKGGREAQEDWRVSGLREEGTLEPDAPPATASFISMRPGQRRRRTRGSMAPSSAMTRRFDSLSASSRSAPGRERRDPARGGRNQREGGGRTASERTRRVGGRESRRALWTWDAYGPSRLEFRTGIEAEDGGTDQRLTPVLPATESQAEPRGEQAPLLQQWRPCCLGLPPGSKEPAGEAGGPGAGSVPRQILFPLSSVPFPSIGHELGLPWLPPPCRCLCMQPAHRASQPTRGYTLPQRSPFCSRRSQPMTKALEPPPPLPAGTPWTGESPRGGSRLPMRSLLCSSPQGQGRGQQRPQPPAGQPCGAQGS